MIKQPEFVPFNRSQVHLGSVSLQSNQHAEHKAVIP